jgi:hypothetical protein
VRKRIFEMVKAVGAASRSEILGGSQGAQTPARFQLIRARQQQGCGYFEIGKPAGFAMLPPSSRRMVRLEPMLGRQASNKP